MAEQAIKEIKEMNNQLMAAFDAQDAEAMAAFYTEDCIFVHGASNMLFRTRAGLIPAFKQLFTTFSSFYFEPIHQTVREDTVTEVGMFRLKLKDSEECKEGKYTSLVVKKDGKWLCQYDMIGNDQ